MPRVSEVAKYLGEELLYTGEGSNDFMVEGASSFSNQKPFTVTFTKEEKFSTSFAPILVIGKRSLRLNAYGHFHFIASTNPRRDFALVVKKYFYDYQQQGIIFSHFWQDFSC